MRKGYRNCTKDFMIDSNLHQFNFSLSDTFLKVDFFEKVKNEMASIERVCFYLKDGRLIKNIFIVAGELAYYFEEGKYVAIANPNDLVHANPNKNLLNQFNFKKEDVVLIRADNNPKPAKKKIDYWLTIEWFFLQKPNPLDTLESIEKNTLVKLDSWQGLPPTSEDDLYVNKSG